MTATFPSEILRNRIYTIQVHGNGASASLSVVADSWEEGDSTESSPDLKGVIDVEASVLPERFGSIHLAIRFISLPK